MIWMTSLVPSWFPYFRIKRKKNVSMVFFSHSFLNESKQKENLEKKYQEIRLIESFTTDNLSIRIHLYSMTPSLKRENFFFWWLLENRPGEEKFLLWFQRTQSRKILIRLQYGFNPFTSIHPLRRAFWRPLFWWFFESGGAKLLGDIISSVHIR